MNNHNVFLTIRHIPIRKFIQTSRRVNIHKRAHQLVLEILNTVLQCNKDENVHRLALSAIRGELLEREREREREREWRHQWTIQ